MRRNVGFAGSKLRFTWFLLVVAAAFVAFTPSASAACVDEGDCDGNALVQICAVTGCGVGGGTRDFCVTTATSCSITDRAHELDAGASITVQYRAAAVNPVTVGIPNTVIINVYHDDTATLVKQLHNGAPPSQGQVFTFHATSTGESGGAPRAGTYRLFIDVENTGIGTSYHADSDGGGDANEWAKGSLLSRLDVSSLTASSPPSGAFFAYGVAGDEDVTLTATVTQPNHDSGSETVRWITRDEAGGALRDSQAATDLDTTSHVFDSTIDSTYAEGLNEYDADFEIVGLSALTGDLWTTLTSGSEGRISSSVARLSAAFDANPNVEFSSDGLAADGVVNTDEVIYNRGEEPDYDFYLLNARSEQITRSMTVQVLSDTGGVEDSQSVSGPNYSDSYTIASGDKATNDDEGSSKTFKATNTDLEAESGTAHSASSLYYADVHTQVNGTLDPDDWPTQDSTEDTAFFIGADNANTWCHVRGVRLDTNIDTSGNAVTISFETPDGDTHTTVSRDTAADGWTTPRLAMAATAPAGVWTASCSVSFGGNSALDEQLVDFVSAFTENLVTLFYYEEATAGENWTIYVHTQVDDVGAEPELVPRIRISQVNTTTGLPVWEVIESGIMANVENWNMEINGSLYAYNFTFTEGGAYNVWTNAQLNAAGIRNSDVISVLSGDPMEVTLTTAFDTYIPILLWFGLMAWFLTRNALMPAIGSLLVFLSLFIPGLPVTVTWGWLFVALFLWVHALSRRNVLLNTDKE